MSSRRRPPPTAVPDWPADAAQIEAARRFLREAMATRAVVVCDSDVDGLAAAVIVERTLSERGAVPVVLPVRRGEHAHHPDLRARVASRQPSRLVVVDQGSRPQRLEMGIPTLVIDHHDASAGTPPDALTVNGFDRPPVATASVLAYVVCREIAALDASAWLATLGAVADIGSAAAYRGVLGRGGGGASGKRAVALLNAARRAPRPRPEIALELLRRSRDLRDITSGDFAETAILEEQQAAVRTEVERCSRVAPRIAGHVALIRFASAAQVHPLVATRWQHRLRPRIVLAANDGYLPDRVNFAVRGGGDIDLVAWLRALPFTPAADAEYGHGHARASGGSLRVTDFERLLRVLGFGTSRQ